jgi:NAD(P)-dependent dehydrogenase (short-subunit alcohol dehydrogenase family)
LIGEVMSTAQKVAVITGASQGIGAALVQAFRSRNYRVVATSRSIKPAADPDIATVQGDVARARTGKFGKIGNMRFILPAMMDLSGRWRGAFTI